MNTLKDQLRLINQNNNQAPLHPFELVLEMIEQIGSPDPELRDGHMLWLTQPMLWMISLKQ